MDYSIIFSKDDIEKLKSQIERYRHVIDQQEKILQVFNLFISAYALLRRGLIINYSIKAIRFLLLLF